MSKPAGLDFAVIAEMLQKADLAALGMAALASIGALVISRSAEHPVSSSHNYLQETLVGLDVGE